MPDLVAVALPGGPTFVEELERAWDAGDAVLPLDPALPAPQLDLLLERMAPARVVTAEGVTDRPGGIPVEPGDALVVTTSGTTGEPKGAVLTHAAVEYAAFASATALGVATDVCWLACLPLSHVGGLSVVTRALHTGVGLEVVPRAEPTVIDRAARDGATHVSLVPTVLRRIDPAPWRTILLGGSAVPEDRPPNTVATYGMTESFGGVVYDGLALNGVSLRIAGPAGAPADEPGPIELRSPTLLRAYRDGTDPLAAHGGWFRTGDLGTLDPSTGRLRVAGRADDLIITGGEKVWPSVVEDALAGHPRVLAVAVAGRPDPEWGDRVVAWVVAADPSTPPTLEDVRAWVKERLPAAAAPRELVLVDSLPRTSLGKIVRGRLE
ncbi:MAG: class I adenylate-forming enzyme family protein [Microthrixaceae bacterium]